jgi:hypothetical protein
MRGRLYEGSVTLKEGCRVKRHNMMQCATEIMNKKSIMLLIKILI